MDQFEFMSVIGHDVEITLKNGKVIKGFCSDKKSQFSNYHLGKNEDPSITISNNKTGNDYEIFRNEVKQIKIFPLSGGEAEIIE